MARHLARAGWRLLARRVPVHGVEVDLVLARRQRVLLVEVKSGRRRGPRWRPADRFGSRERARLERALLAWRRRRPADEEAEVRLYEVLAPRGARARIERVALGGSARAPD